jgi:uncharacterized protein (TIGR02452 family)
MEREDLIKVFAETVNCVNKGFYINKKGEKVEIPSEHDGLSIDNVTFYDSDIKKKINFDKLKRYSTEISVVNQDCLIAAKELYDDGYSPAVVNFASFKVPGGGVRKGSRAQEENLCRRTNLFESIFRFIDTLSKEYGLPLEKKRYPLPVNHGAIYSPSISVFRESDDKNYEFLDELFSIDVITIAALKNPPLDSKGHMNDWAKSITKEKIRTMLNLAIYWENDSIVLGAFGCGAFANPPEDVAKLFKEVLNEPEYCDKFEKIVFAVLDDGNSHREHNPRGNYLPFAETFSE